MNELKEETKQSKAETQIFEEKYETMKTTNSILEKTLTEKDS